MAIALVVTHPFANYAKGDQITRPYEIQSALVDQPNRVVRIEVPDQQAALPPAPKAG